MLLAYLLMAVGPARSRNYLIPYGSIEWIAGSKRKINSMRINPITHFPLPSKLGGLLLVGDLVVVVGSKNRLGGTGAVDFRIVHNWTARLPSFG